MQTLNMNKNINTFYLLENIDDENISPVPSAPSTPSRKPTQHDCSAPKKQQKLKMELTQLLGFKMFAKDDPERKLVSEHEISQVTTVSGGKPSEANQIRTEGFNKIADKKEFTKTLAKTKFCQNVIKGGKCTRDVCTFAHNLEEFSPNCAFGGACKFEHSKTKPCPFLHPGTTIVEYCKKIGIPSWVVDKSSPEVAKPVKPAETVKPHVLPKPVEKPVEIIKPVERQVEEEETLIKVPAEIAMMAVELALKQGKKNIRLIVL